MCGRIALHHAVAKVESAFGTVLRDRAVAPVARYNIAPGQPVLVVRSDSVSRVKRELVHLLWGLIPPWQKQLTAQGGLINARGETAHEKPSFRHALRRRRCIIPASGFYEWKRSSCTHRTPQPYYFRDPQGKVLAMAGLWEIWHGPAGEVIESFCLLTQTASGVMEPIHDRMPVILPLADIDDWLDPHQEEPPQDLLACKRAGELVCDPVSTDVNSSRTEGAHLIEPIILSPPTPPSVPAPPAVQQQDLFGATES